MSVAICGTLILPLLSFSREKFQCEWVCVVIPDCSQFLRHKFTADRSYLPDVPWVTHSNATKRLKSLLEY
jgi:hypothetical protein